TLVTRDMHPPPMTPRSAQGARIRCHNRHGLRDCVTPHPLWGVFWHSMIRPAAAAHSGEAGVTAEVTRPAASRIRTDSQQPGSRAAGQPAPLVRRRPLLAALPQLRGQFRGGDAAWRAFGALVVELAAVLRHVR